jgi:ABC-2 type transport system permease protein
MNSLSAAPGLTWSRVLAAEQRRMRTLRSTWWFAASAVVLTVAIGVFPAIGVAVGALPADPATVGPLGGALTGLGLTELIVAAFAVLAVTGEPAAVTFTAVPRRASVVVGRTAAVGAWVLTVALALTFGTFAAVHLLLRSAGMDLFLNAPGVARSLVGAAVHLAFVAVLGVAAGWLLRGAVAGIAAVVGIFYLLPVVGLLLPDAAAGVVLPWLPSNAAAALREPVPTPEMLPAWLALLALAAYAAGAVALATAAVRRRDV